LTQYLPFVRIFHNTSAPLDLLGSATQPENKLRLVNTNNGLRGIIMKKSRLLGAVCACVLTVITSVSQAISLQNGDVLSFTTAAGSGASGTVGEGAGLLFDSTGLDALNGLILGSSQPGIPDIDQTWTSTVAGVSGNHRTTSSVDVLSASTLDFSGWVMTLVGGGTDFAFGATQGIADYTFNGTNFTINYHWDAVSDNGGVGLGDANVTVYDLTLAGTVSSVPVPAAIWLFGSGLLGLIGIARRRKAV
jgi:hypothetical protein